jgi:cold shock CspA family protein
VSSRTPLVPSHSGSAEMPARVGPPRPRLTPARAALAEHQASIAQLAADLEHTQRPVSRLRTQLATAMAELEAAEHVLTGTASGANKQPRQRAGTVTDLRSRGPQLQACKATMKYRMKPITGRIKFYDEEGAYGLIKQDGGGPDLLFHARDLGFAPKNGQAVAFVVETHDRGPRAAGVRQLDEDSLRAARSRPGFGLSAG